MTINSRQRTHETGGQPISSYEYTVRDSYHALAMALDLLAEMHDDELSMECIKCAQRCAERLYNSTLCNCAASHRCYPEMRQARGTMAVGSRRAGHD